MRLELEAESDCGELTQIWRTEICLCHNELQDLAWLAFIHMFKMVRGLVCLHSFCVITMLMWTHYLYVCLIIKKIDNGLISSSEKASDYPWLFYCVTAGLIRQFPSFMGLNTCCLVKCELTHPTCKAWKQQLPTDSVSPGVIPSDVRGLHAEGLRWPHHCPRTLHILTCVL